MGLFSTLLRSSQKLSFDCWPHQRASTSINANVMNSDKLSDLQQFATICNLLQSFAIVCNIICNYHVIIVHRCTHRYTREREREKYSEILRGKGLNMKKK